jgi:DNA-binding XRE family transcriptional regulator
MGVKIARIKKGLNQLELCKLLNISHSTLSKIENGDKQISLSTAKKISDFFNIPIDDLFFYEDSEVA